MRPIPIWTNDLGNIRIYRFDARTRAILYRTDDMYLETHSVSFPELFLAIKRDCHSENCDQLITGVSYKHPISSDDSSAILYPLDFCNNDGDGFTCLGRTLGLDLDDQQILDLFWLSEFTGLISYAFPLLDDPSRLFSLFSQAVRSGNPPKNTNKIKFKFDKKHICYSLYRKTLSKFIESELTKSYIDLDGFKKLHLRRGYSSLLRSETFVVNLHECQIMDGIRGIDALRSLHKSFSDNGKDLYLSNPAFLYWMEDHSISRDNLTFEIPFYAGVGLDEYQLCRLVSVK